MGIEAGSLSLGVWGVVFLLVVRCLGKYYSYVGRQISPSLKHSNAGKIDVNGILFIEKHPI